MAFAVTFSFASKGAAPIQVHYEVHTLTSSATRNPDGTWTVPTGERVEWAVLWTIANASGQTVSDVRLGDNFSAEMDVDTRSISGSTGRADAQHVGGPHSATAVTWSIGTMPPGSSAQLSFRVGTGLNPAGKQEYTSPGQHCMDSGLTVKWKGGSYPLPPVCLVAKERPWIQVEVTTTKAWRIRKPGDFASLGLRARIASNGSVTIQFQGFSDLQPLSGGSRRPVPTFYSVGSTLEEASAAGWWRAQEFNGQAISLPASPALLQGVTWTLWQRVVVDAGQSSAEYQNRATVLFVVGNMSTAVVNNGSP